jgi:hypothetical protein
MVSVGLAARYPVGVSPHLAGWNKGSILIVVGLVLIMLAGTSRRSQAQPSAEASAEASAGTLTDSALGQSVLALWLEAQNRDDFAAYTALYAPSFTGVKRVGTQVKLLDRSGWLKDRKGMFAAKIEVTATDPVITRQGDTLVIELTQRWEQKLFADVGRKRLVVNTLPGAGPILYEEMLSSRLMPSKDACRRSAFPPHQGLAAASPMANDSVESVEVIDLGVAVFVCRIDHRATDATGLSIDLVTLARATWGNVWSPVSRISHRVEDSSTYPMPFMSLDDPVDETTDHDYTLELVAISSKESAVLVLQTDRTSSKYQSDSKTSAQLLRATDTGLVALLQYDSTRSDDVESNSYKRCSLLPGSRRRHGLFDLLLECTSAVSNWHDDDPAKRGMQETTQTTIHRWTGKRYDPVSTRHTQTQ